MGGVVTEVTQTVFVAAAAMLAERDVRVERLNATIVCTIGSIRGGRLAVSSLVANVLRPLRADLAVLLSVNAEATSAHALELVSHAKHVWRVPDALGWNGLLDELIPHWSSTIDPSLLRDNVWGGLVSQRGKPPIPGSGAIIFILRLVLLGYLDALRGHRYRQVIVTRSDHWFACAHPRLSVHEDAVHVPDGEDYWGGVTDRHVVFAFASRARVLGVLPWLLRHDNATSLINTERVIGAYFTSSRLAVRRFPRPMVVIRGAGDRSRWSTVHEPIPGRCDGSDGGGGSNASTRPLEHTLKYPYEYASMAGTCKLTMAPCASSNAAFARYLHTCAQLERRPLQATLGLNGGGEGGGGPLRACGLARAQSRCQDWNAWAESLSADVRDGFVARAHAAVENHTRSNIDAHTRAVLGRPATRPARGMCPVVLM